MDLSFFTWQVSLDGYRFSDIDGGAVTASGHLFERRRYLTTGKPLLRGARHRSYRLQQLEPALFRRFAELEPTEDAIVAFAAQYGHLGLYDWVDVGRDGSGSKPGETWRLAQGERLSTWESETAAMRWCFGLWEALRTDDAASVARLLHVGMREGRYITGVGGIGDREPNGLEYTVRDYLPAQDPGRNALQFAVNRELSGHCRPKLLYDQASGSFRTAIAPESLLGAMWLQLALYVEGQVVFEQCEAPGCTAWFQVHPDRNSPRKRFCSHKCRMRAHRAQNGGAK